MRIILYIQNNACIKNEKKSRRSTHLCLNTKFEKFQLPILCLCNVKINIWFALLIKNNQDYF